MKPISTIRSLALFAAALALWSPRAVLAADPTGGKINHIIILMLENRAFDSYLGQLATKGVYAPCTDDGPTPACGNDAVNGLSCTVDSANNYACTNSNPKGFTGLGTASCAPDSSAGTQTVFHDPSYCTADTNHEWVGTHHEFNECNPTSATGMNDGFYVQNENNGRNTTIDMLTGMLSRSDPTRTLGFYDDTDLPFYYSLAGTFAIGDRYFCSILGPTIPNRMYLMAGTSFGHVHTVPDLLPPPGGNTPTTGNVFKSMNAKGVTWKDYFHDIPQAGLFDVRDALPTHFADINELFLDLASPAETDALGPLAPLPQVSFVDPPFTQPQVVIPDASLNVFSSDEHPPKDIQFGQQLAARVVNAVLSSPHYADTVLFITYDEHGGFYDHVPPPSAPDPNDGILPGDCPASSFGLLAPTGTPLDGVTGPIADQYKANFCKGPEEPALKIPFDHLGIRVPFYVISPYAKRHYVSHTILDHTSLLHFVEERFGLPTLTARDAAANLPLDVFDFSQQNLSPVTLTQPGIPKLDPLLDPHCYEGVELF